MQKKQLFCKSISRLISRLEEIRFDLEEKYFIDFCQRQEIFSDEEKIFSDEEKIFPKNNLW